LPLNRKSVVARTNCTHGIRPTAATAGCAGRLAFRFAAARPEVVAVVATVWRGVCAWTAREAGRLATSTAARDFGAGGGGGGGTRPAARAGIGSASERASATRTAIDRMIDAVVALIGVGREALVIRVGLEIEAGP
jgi:hypothetical protein